MIIEESQMGLLNQSIIKLKPLLRLPMALSLLIDLEIRSCIQ